MRIQILSDIHAEFHSDGGEQFIDEYLRPAGVDALVVAGDAGSGRSLTKSLTQLSRKYSNSAVLYVPGNHDFYHNSFQAVLQQLTLLDDEIDNFFLMHDRLLVVDGVSFVGSTLWFPKEDDYKHYAMMLNDFRMIDDFTPEVFKVNRTAVEFLKWHVHKDSVVVTHHMPTYKSVGKQYEGDKLNMFFVCDLEPLILEREPKLWVHGHTHSSFNYMLGKTHVVCNPLGYVGHQLNSEFIANMMFDV